MKSLLLSLLGVACLTGPGIADPLPAPRSTVSFDAGIGVQFAGDSIPRDTKVVGVVGVQAAGRLSDKVTLGARITASIFNTRVDGVDDTRLLISFLGPSLQAWVMDHVWLGVAVGVVTVNVTEVDSAGIELRAGHDLTDHFFVAGSALVATDLDAVDPLYAVLQLGYRL